MSGRTFKIPEPSPAVVQRANQIVSQAGARTARAKAIALFNFVRDSIKFGFTGKFDYASPEETLRLGIGHCNPQGALFASLLQAEGIPARQHFVNLGNGVLRGVLRSAPPRLVHNYVEVHLPVKDDTESVGEGRVGSQVMDESPGEWLRVDAYIADPPLFHAAKSRLVKEGREEGYGIHVDGSNEWDGRSDSFCQMADEDSQVSQDLGVFDEPHIFYDSQRNFQRLSWPISSVFGLIVAIPNSASDATRREYVGDD
ncbi:unnamed protein product [Ascophyllum nodosum]